MNIFLTFLVLLIIIMIYKTKNSNKLKKNNLFKFKTKFLSKESNIEKILSLAKLLGKNASEFFGPYKISEK